MFFTLFVFTATSAAAPAARADDVATGPQEARRWTQMQEVLAEAPKPTSVRARYVQIRTSLLLNDEVRSEGRFRAADGIARWSLDTPSRLEMRVDANQMRIYYVADRVVEVYPVAGHALPIAEGRPDLGRLAKDFRLRRVWREENVWGMELEAYGEMRKKLLSLVLSFDSDKGLIVSARTTDPAEDQTQMLLIDIDTDTPLDPSDLVLDVPPDVRVIYPAGVDATNATDATDATDTSNTSNTAHATHTSGATTSARF